MYNTNGVIVVLLGIIMILVFLMLLGSAVDDQIDNQNVMLCESALISGNREYQKKCQPYYESHNITIVRESL